MFLQKFTAGLMFMVLKIRKTKADSREVVKLFRKRRKCLFVRRQSQELRDKIFEMYTLKTYDRLEFEKLVY